MYSEIIFEVLKYIFYSLSTKIPYKWDFCRILLEGDVRLYINVGSYFIAYVAFVFWFTKYVLWELRCLAGEKLGKRHWYSAIGLSLSTAIHFLWPAFLMATYFVSCSFYPWFTATLVFFLNVSFFMPSLFVDGARKGKSMIQAALARWKKKTESQSSSDLIDYSSPYDSSEDSLTSVFDNSENIPGMENKETASTEKQPMERLKSQVLSSIGGGIDRIKSLFQTAFDRISIFQVQSEKNSTSYTDNKDTGGQSTESASTSSGFDDKNFLYSIFKKARSSFDISDEFNIMQPDSSTYKINNTSDLFENTQRLDKSISEPQQLDKFKDDDNQPEGKRDYKSTIW